MHSDLLNTYEVPGMAEASTVNDVGLAAPENDNNFAVKRVFTAPMAKTFRRRASTACAYCQFRKIRCSVEEGMPCNNCRLEKIECRITKRRKTKHKKSLPGSHQPPSTEPASASAVSNAIASSPPKVIESLQTNAPLIDVSMAVDEPRSNIDASREPPQAAAAYFTDLTIDLAASNSLSPQSCRSSSALRDMPLKRPTNKPTLPGYLEPIPDHLAPDDLDYLQAKGAFDIPGDKFRNAVLRSYSQFLQIYMPMLDIGDFLTVVASGKNDGRQVSLLVFQAIMFAGCAHVDVKPLRSMGFLTRKAARQVLFQRTKALYQLGYEQNRIYVVQALLLMSYWYQTPDDQFDSFHWLQIALQLARRAGLDQDPATMIMPEAEKRLRRRIWWCFLIRDPLVALGTKRPISVPIDENHVPGLIASDFEGDQSMRDGLIAVGLDWDPAQLRLLRSTCISQTKLHQCLSMILSKQYALGDYHHAKPLMDPKSTRAILLPVTTDEAFRTLPECEQRLRAWRESLGPELISTQLSEESPYARFDAFLVFRIMLHMIYHTCIITMYRPWVGVARQGRHLAFHDQIFQAKIRTAIRASAESITDLAVELHNADLARHLPQTGLSAMAAAIVSHLADATSDDETMKEPALRRFEQCSHIINELRENYYSADFTSDFVNVIAQSKNVASALAQSSPARNSGLPPFDLEEQSSAQETFLGGGPGSLSGRSDNSVKRPLPEALFPQGTHLELDVALPQNEMEGQQQDTDILDPVNQTAEQQQVPASLMASWDTFRDLREDSTRVFGDFFEEYEFFQFNTLSGIDLGA